MNSRYIFILGTLLLLISCHKEPEDVYFPLDRTNWFNYSVGDSLIFKSSSSAIDTYVLNKVDTFYRNYNNGHAYNEILLVSYEGSVNCNNCPIDEFHRTSELVSYYGKIYTSKFEYSKISSTKYQLGDTLLEDIYVVDDIPTEDTLRHQIKAIYYSDIYGIIRYDMYDDRVYELQLE